jgi:hypothetical protein
LAAEFKAVGNNFFIYWPRKNIDPTYNGAGEEIYALLIEDAVTLAHRAKIRIFWWNFRAVQDCKILPAPSDRFAKHLARAGTLSDYIYYLLLYKLVINYDIDKIYSW